MRISRSSSADMHTLNGGRLARVPVGLNFWKSMVGQFSQWGRFKFTELSSQPLEAW